MQPQPRLPGRHLNADEEHERTGSSGSALRTVSYRQDNCYDLILIAAPKTFHMHNISAIFPSHPIIPICGKISAIVPFPFYVASAFPLAHHYRAVLARDS
jgi:hypothetical protein